MEFILVNALEKKSVHENHAGEDPPIVYSCALALVKMLETSRCYVAV